MTITAIVCRHGGRLSIGWDAESWQDRSGDYPATEEGLESLKLDLKNDNYAAAEDFDAIDALKIPTHDGRGEEIALHGEG